MVKTMFNERMKSGINPIVSVIIWGVSLYVFYVIWGICEILFEFSFSALMHILMLLATVVFGWFLISKVLTEYEISIEERKINITKIQSRRRRALVALIASDNIADVCNENKKKTKYKDIKYISFVRPSQKGEIVYLIYKDEDKLSGIKMKGSKKLASALKQERK